MVQVARFDGSVFARTAMFFSSLIRRLTIRAPKNEAEKKSSGLRAAPLEAFEQFVEAAANKAEDQWESYHAGLFRANGEVEFSSMR